MTIDCHIGKHTINHMKIKEEPMKKIIAVILALTMLLALAACTAKTETTTTDTAADAATTTDLSLIHI